MSWSRPLLGLIGIMALAGCGAIAGLSPAAQPAGPVTRTEAQGGRFVTLAGPQIQHAEPFLGVSGTNFSLLRSMIDTRTGEIAHQLYVEDSYFGAERNWNAARDATGQPLRFIPISKNEITCDAGCSHAEEFAASLPDALLRASPQGFTVVFTARTGVERIVAVPGDLIAKQLAAVAAARANPATAATIPAAASTPVPPR